jgi:hypothetical protein
VGKGNPEALQDRVRLKQTKHHQNVNCTERDSLTRLWCPFFIYLDKYEVPNRAGSGLFFILKWASYLNFYKSLYCQYIKFESADPGIVTVRRNFGEF